MVIADPTTLPKLAYSVTEAAQATGVSKRTIRDAISDGTLPARKRGRRWIIPALALYRWVGGE